MGDSWELGAGSWEGIVVCATRDHETVTMKNRASAIEALMSALALRLRLGSASIHASPFRVSSFSQTRKTPSRYTKTPAPQAARKLHSLLSLSLLHENGGCAGFTKNSTVLYGLQFAHCSTTALG